MLGYNVVFEGTGKSSSNFEGIRIITGFESEEAFEKWLAETQCCDIIVARGVSDEEAHRLTAETTGTARAAALVRQIAENPAAAQMHIVNAEFVAAHDGKLDEFHAALQVLRDAI